jgi:hypothetical protein
LSGEGGVEGARGTDAASERSPAARASFQPITLKVLRWVERDKRPVVKEWLYRPVEPGIVVRRDCHLICAVD